MTETVTEILEFIVSEGIKVLVGNLALLGILSSVHIKPALYKYA